jgi:hypothetical protein
LLDARIVSGLTPTSALIASTLIASTLILWCTGCGGGLRGNRCGASLRHTGEEEIVLERVLIDEASGLLV